MSDSTTYGPIFVPRVSAIGYADYSCASRHIIAKEAAGSKGEAARWVAIMVGNSEMIPDRDTLVGIYKS